MPTPNRKDSLPDNEIALVQRNGSKVEDRREYSLDDRDDETPMHNELTERRGPLVAVAAMNENEPGDVTELRD